MKDRYDVVIIGSGLGGLACGSILSKEGMSVCVLERHSVIGGCFQSFKRGRYTLDTGIHYVGSLAPGQTMNQYFKYFGVLDKIRLRRLDEDAFDKICFSDGKCYAHAMGYDAFQETLSRSFPDQREGLADYCDMLRKVGGVITPQVLRQGLLSSGGIEFMGQSIYDEIARMISDQRLRNVLAGSISQYAGHPDKSSVYEHAMVNHSNIEGSYSFVGGTQHVADAFADVIRANGGEVYTSSEVTGIHLEGDKAEWVEVNGQHRIMAANVISAIHPSVTLSLLENNTVIKKAYFTRVNSLENSYGIFTTYLLLKPDTFKYKGTNMYLYDTPSVWSAHQDCMNDELRSMLVCMQPKEGSQYTDVVTLLTPMIASQMEKWSDTHVGRRGDDYVDFKEKYAQRMIDFACRWIPELRGCIHAVHTASPLTYRDYTLTPQGSAYGIVKNYNNPVVCHLPSRTKVSNLFITGQNLNVHGCIGVAVSAAVTCSEFLGTEYLAKKIGNA
ncbi:MAG: NAD(P)/FAD-dependent oxidoreductase [Bacteroidales bacterium]|nr:NAD(P)/FAD-dependent oxidoreductase [Bacteroidales bacterium]